MTWLDLARRGKTTWWRYLVAWPLAIVAAILTIALLLAAPIWLRWLPASIASDMQSAAHPILFYGGQGLSFAAFLLGFWAAIRLMHGKRFADIRGAWRWRQFFTGAGVWLIALILCTLIDYALRPKGFVLRLNLTPAVALVAALGLLVQTFTEEFVFRGYLSQSVLLATKNPVVTVIVSALLFGALHIPNGLPQAAGAVMFGLAATTMALRTDSLSLSYGVHFVNNLFGAIVVVSANDVFKGAPALITQNTPDLMWSDTVIGAVALLAATVLLLRPWKRTA